MEEYLVNQDLEDRKDRTIRLAISIWILLLCTVLLSVNMSWANERRRIVAFQPGTSDAAKAEILQHTDCNCTILSALPIVNAITIELPPEPDTQAAETYLLNQPEVKEVHQDPSLKAQSEPQPK